MRDPSTPSVLDSHRLARAFLALADDVAPQAVQRSAARAGAAFATALVLALAPPVTLLAPASPVKVADQPAATLGSKAVLAEADDEDDDAGGTA
jgi:hypothetical protein